MGRQTEQQSRRGGRATPAGPISRTGRRSARPASWRCWPDRLPESGTDRAAPAAPPRRSTERPTMPTLLTGRDSPAWGLPERLAAVGLLLGLAGFFIAPVP